MNDKQIALELTKLIVNLASNKDMADTRAKNALKDNNEQYVTEVYQRCLKTIQTE